MATTIATVTPQQIDACSRLYDLNRKEVFYQVQSESDPTKTYEVRFNKVYRRLTCTCPAGQEGFNCKHRRWVGEAEKEHRQLKAAEREAQERIEQEPEQREITHLVNQGVARADAERIVYANSHPVQHTAAEIQTAQALYKSRPFSLLA